MKTVFVYINAEVGDADHVKVFGDERDRDA
jgi:hypothetical protein